MDILPEAREVFNEWLEHFNDGEATKRVSKKVLEVLDKLNDFTDDQKTRRFKARCDERKRRYNNPF